MNAKEAMQVFYERLQQYEQSGFSLTEPIRVLVQDTLPHGKPDVGTKSVKAHESSATVVLARGGLFHLFDGYIHSHQLWLRFAGNHGNSDRYYCCLGSKLLLKADSNLRTLLESVLDGQISLVGGSTADLLVHLASVANKPQTVKPLETHTHDSKVYGYF